MIHRLTFSLLRSYRQVSLIASPYYKNKCNWSALSVHKRCSQSPSLLDIARRTLKTMTTAQEVKHDADERAFYMQIQKGHVAMLQYEWMRDGVINFYHTEVPPVYRGQGLAKYLAKAALDYAVEKDAKMVLSCSYLSKYLQENPLPQYTSRLLTE